MHVNTISLINFGVFRGRHSIDLRTAPNKPVILFGGKNGAGKSTIMEAVYLCLYGSLAAAKMSKEQYTGYLEQKIHTSPNLLVQPTFASVSIEFSYADLGRVHVYEVTRSWGKASSGRTTERLDVKRDGASLGDLGSEQWQDFIRELIPLGVSNLFFFDGEKIQHLAEDATDKAELARSVKALLGVNLIERLHADLSLYQARLTKSNGHATGSASLDQLNADLSNAETQLAGRQEEHRRLETLVHDQRARLTQIEQSISAEGGGFAKRRDGLVRKREEVRARVVGIEAAIRQLCHGLLPFALAPGLLSDLDAQLRLEEIVQARETGETLLISARDRFIELINAEPAFSKKPTRLKDRAIALLDSAVSSANAAVAAPATVLHSLSGSTSRQLLHWIHQSLTDVPISARGIGDELEIFSRELHKAEEELKKVPADEILAPLVEQLNVVDQEIGNATRQLLTSEESLRAAESKVADLRKRVRDEIEKLNLQAAINSRVRLLPRIQSALDDFTTSLITERVHQLEVELTDCFNVLSRKTDSVRRASISPLDFAVTLYDRGDSPITKQALSAGEKQIYAIAVLWALARVSRRPLPLIIDTPLGRLDSDHRRLLVEGYFPNASHQVVLLSTDTEVDHVYFDALKPHVARAYRLEFDMAERCTTIESGYFKAATA